MLPEPALVPVEAPELDPAVDPPLELPPADEPDPVEAACVALLVLLAEELVDPEAADEVVPLVLTDAVPVVAAGAA